MRAAVIDNDLHANDIFSKLLNQSGMVVVTQFKDTIEAMTWLKLGKVDVIFIAVDNYGIDGLNLAHEIIDYNSNISVVFLTNNNSSIIEALRLSLLHYLIKPVEKFELKQTFRRVFGEGSPFIDSESISLKCFGGMKVVSEAGEIVRLRWAKAEELLAYFMDRGAKGADVREILSAIWPGMDENTALLLFNIALYNIKIALASVGIEKAVICDQEKYYLVMHRYSCDLWQFEKAFELLDDITIENAHHYEKILSLYGNDYLAKEQYQWVTDRRQNLQDAYICINLAVVGYYIENGMFRKAVYLLRRALAVVPSDQKLNQELLKIY